MSKIKTCKQCNNDFECSTRSVYCPTCSREAMASHHLPKVVASRLTSPGHGMYPRDYSRMKYGFMLMGAENE